MKSSVCVSLVLGLALVIGIQVARSQDKTFTSAQQTAYNRSRLAIEISEKARGSVGSYGSFSYSSWTDWTAYEGFTEISEEDFFRKAGYLKEAEEASSYRGTGKLLLWGGIAVSAGGLAMMFAGMGNTDDPTLMYVGAGLALGGMIPVYVGAEKLGKNWAPYSTVNGIADNYNKQLVIRIKKEF